MPRGSFQDVFRARLGAIHSRREAAPCVASAGQVHPPPAPLGALDEAVRGKTSGPTGPLEGRTPGDEERGSAAPEDAFGFCADALDPFTRHLAHLAPPLVMAANPISETPALRAPLSLETLIPALVKRIAWSGDKHRGSVRLEIGAGAYAGATLLVHADDGRLRIEVSGSDSASLERLRARLQERLQRHGLDVESIV